MTSQINLDQQVVVPYNFTSSPSTPRLEALRLEGIVARRSLHGSTTSLQSCLKDPLVRTMVIFACVCVEIDFDENFSVSKIPSSLQRFRVLWPLLCCLSVFLTIVLFGRFCSTATAAFVFVLSMCFYFWSKVKPTEQF